jgi:ABC-type dipeptide/oligopeptide/nickel transport system permease subunit
MAVINASDVDTAIDFARPGKARSLWSDAWIRLRRNKLALGGAVVLLLLALIAVAAPVIAPYPYDKTVRDPVTKKVVPNLPPAWAAGGKSQYLLGTDEQSRDEFSRVIYGAQISLSVGLVSQIIILCIGIPMGLIAGYYGKGVDMVLMRITDVMYAFPTVLFAVVILAALGPSLFNIYAAIGFTFWPPMARLVRSLVRRSRRKSILKRLRRSA